MLLECPLISPRLPNVAGGVGGVEMLDAGSEQEGASGWDLLGALLAAEWEDRPSATEALLHPFWEAKMSPEPPA